MKRRRCCFGFGFFFGFFQKLTGIRKPAIYIMTCGIVGSFSGVAAHYGNQFAARSFVISLAAFFLGHVAATDNAPFDVVHVTNIAYRKHTKQKNSFGGGRRGGRGGGGGRARRGGGGGRGPAGAEQHR